MKRKEQWIDETLNSLDGIRPATPGNSFTEGIFQKISNQNSNTVISGKGFIWRAAATVLILISLNLITGIISNSENLKSADSSKSSTEYLDYITPFNF